MARVDRAIGRAARRAVLYSRAGARGTRGGCAEGRETRRTRPPSRVGLGYGSFDAGRARPQRDHRPGGDGGPRKLPRRARAGRLLGRGRGHKQALARRRARARHGRRRERGRRARSGPNKNAFVVFVRRQKRQKRSRRGRGADAPLGVGGSLGENPGEVRVFENKRRRIRRG